MPADAAVFLDTNVLLAATSPGRPRHERALQVVESWPGEGAALFWSGQVVREYVAVATRPAEANGLALSVPDAWSNVEALRPRLHFLDEDRRVADALEDLARRFRCRGKRVHDANIVATLLVHGVPALLTDNVADFRAFRELIEIRDLARA